MPIYEYKCQDCGRVSEFFFHSIQMTVVYDNNSYDKELKIDWGFSCYIEGLEKTILFAKAYQDDFIEVGAGKRITLP